jgi:hypothetical protein
VALFKRKPPEPTVDDSVARRAADAVNRGDVDEADRIVNATSNPRAHAFAAFRYIGLEDDHA